MLRKLIQVGSSAAVIVPKDALEEQHVDIGDMIEFTFVKAGSKKILPVRPEVMAWVEKTIEDYRPLLEKLSKS